MIKTDKYMYVLGILVTIGFFTLLGILSFIAVKPENSDLLNIALGILGTAFITIVNYFFGSSQGSKVKTEMMHKENEIVGTVG